MQDILKAGNVVEFLYPRHNFQGVHCSRKERRLIVVERVRDLREEPLCKLTLEQHASLQRGTLLVIGLDLQKNERRSFYVESMSRLKLLDAEGVPRVPLRCIIVNDDGSLNRVVESFDAREAMCESYNRFGLGSFSVIV